LIAPLIRLLSVAVATLALSTTQNNPATTQHVSEYHSDPDAPPVMSKKELLLCEAVDGLFVDTGEKPLPDPAISIAARDLLGLLADSHGQMEQPAINEWTDFFLRRAGVTDALFYPLLIPLLDDDSPFHVTGVLSDIELGAMRLNRYGLAHRPGDDGLVVLIFTRRMADIAPFPVKVEPGSSHLLWGTLLQDSRDPSLLLASDELGIVESRPSQKAGMFWTQIYFPDEPGEYLVELLVQADGPQVASLFPVFVGVAPHSRPVTRLLPGVDERASVEELERQALKLINAERKRRGVKELLHNPALASSAKSHSKAMASLSRLTHEPLPGEVRLKHHYKENVSISSTLASAHRNLMKSPSHRRTILDSELAYVGIGIVESGRTEDERIIYMTQRFSAGTNR